MTLRFNKPTAQVFISWYTYPELQDPAQDWIFQRYYELVKLKVAEYHENTYGDSSRAKAYVQPAAMLLNAFLADNGDTDAES
jgi:hypothetical protein